MYKRQPHSVRTDAPIRIGKWTPSNYDDKYRGPVTLAEALTDSLNTIAAQLVMETGPENVIKTAHRMGIESTLQPNSSLALGTSEVTLAELTAAYAPFMNGGYKATPHIIARVRTADGQVLYQNTYDNPPRVLRPDVIAMMNSMMVQVVSEGTGRRARLGGHVVAGKTGTSQAFRDALFVGYTSSLATGVWFGNDDGKPTRKVTGGAMPAAAFQEFMQVALNGEADIHLPGQFEVPVDPSRVAIPVARPAHVPGRRNSIAGSDRRPRAPVNGVSQDRTGSTRQIKPPADVPHTGETTLLDIILGN